MWWNTFQSDSVCRGAIKEAHQAMCFFGEVCGVAEAARWTNAAIYLLAKKEILASALPGALPRQVFGFPTVILAALEGLTLDVTVFLISAPVAGAIGAVVGNIAILGSPENRTDACPQLMSKGSRRS